MAVIKDKYAKLVKWLKIFCIISLLALLALFIFSDFFIKRENKISINISTNSQINSGEKNKMSHMTKPRFQGYSTKNEPYNIKAKKAHWQKKGTYFLDDVDADFTMQNGNWFFLVSDKATFFEQKGKVDLSKNVILHYNYDYSLKTNFLEVDIKDFSCRNFQETQIQGPGFLLKSGDFHFNSKDMTSHHQQGACSEFTKKGQPQTKIKSEKVKINHKNKIATYEGTVFASRGHLNIETDFLQIHYGSTEAEARKIIAKNNVKLTDNKIRAFAKEANYIASKNILILEKDVELHKDGSIAKGDKLIYDIKQESAIMNNVNSQQRPKIILKSK